MIVVSKSARRDMMDTIANALTECDSVDDRLPDLISTKYGHRLISTNMGRLSGNCEVVYDFAESEFGTGEWTRVYDPRQGRTVRHYSGSAELRNVLPFIYQEGEEEPRQRPIYVAVWNGYDYDSEIDGYEDDYDNPIVTHGRWHEYRGNIARAIAAMVVPLILRHADSPIPYGSYDRQNWLYTQLETPAPERRTITADEWFRGFDGIACWRGYRSMADVANFLPWTLTRDAAPSSAEYPTMPNHRRLSGALPPVGQRERWYSERWYEIERAAYAVLNDLEARFGYWGDARVNFRDTLNRWQDQRIDDRTLLLAIRANGGIV